MKQMAGDESGPDEGITLVGLGADSIRLTPQAAKVLLQIVLEHREKNRGGDRRGDCQRSSKRSSPGLPAQ